MISGDVHARQTWEWSTCVLSTPRLTYLAHCFLCKVNLWAVARQSLEAPNPRRVAPRLRQARAPVGFEHALSVDLAELVGARDGMGEGGGAKHIALHGNLLAVATDHAVFLVHLTFDVKGEQTHELLKVRW